MSLQPWQQRVALGFAAAAWLGSAAAQQPLRLIGGSHWLLDRQGRLSLAVVGGREARAEIDLGAGQAIRWDCAGWPVVTASGQGWRARLLALSDPDLLVVELSGDGHERPIAVQWSHATTITAQGTAMLGLSGGLSLAVQAAGAQATRRSAGGGFRVPAAGGYLVLAAGREAAELEGRLRRVAPALTDLLATARVRWAMRVHDARRWNTGDARLDQALRQAQQQLLASADVEGRLWDQHGPRSLAPPPGTAIDAAAALWSCGLVQASRRILAAAAVAASPDELRLLQARAHLWRARGRLGAPAAWEARRVDTAEPRLDRELETGHSQRVKIVPDLVEVAAGSSQSLPALEQVWFAGGDRLLLAADPLDERVACWHLWLAAPVFDLPLPWREAVARTAPQVVAKLLRRDGTLALRASVGRSGLPGADARPSPSATALLAFWRLQRQDRDGAWRCLVAIANRQAASGEPWLPWAWQEAHSPPSSASCHVSATGAALFLLAAGELFGQPASAGRPGEAAEGPAAIDLEPGREGSAAAFRLPAMLEHLVLGGPVYQHRFAETAAIVRHLAATEIAIVRTRRQPSPLEEERAIADLLRLGSAVEGAFEAGLRR